MRVVWGFVAGALALVAALLVAVAIVLVTRDAQRLTAPLRDYVKAETGRDLAIGGADVTVSLAPRLVLRDVSLGNAPWAAGSSSLLRAKEVDVEIALPALLRGQIEVLSFELVEPVIALETRADGRGNWEFDAAPAAERDAGKPAPRALHIGGRQIALTRGTLTYRDGRTGESVRVGIDSLTLRARDPGSAIAAEFRGQIDGVPVALEGTLGPLSLLTERRWPYAVSAQGSVDGRAAGIATKIRPVATGWSFDETTVSFERMSASGSLRRVAGGARAKWIVDLTIPVLAPTGGVPSQPPAGPAAARAVADVPLPLDLLAVVDAEGTLRIDRLNVATARTAVIEAVQLRFALERGRLEIDAFSARALGGTLTGALTIDGAASQRSAVALRLAGRGISLPQAMAQAGMTKATTGGTLRLDADLATHGGTFKQWVAGLGGALTVEISGAAIDLRGRDAGHWLDRLAVGLDPVLGLRKVNELQCVVVRLPLAHGVARIDRSIAAETADLGASARGTIDFGRETLDLAFDLRPKRALPIDLPRLSQIVRLRGSLADPQFVVDTTASVSAAARLGAAIGTGGLPALGLGLVERGAAGAARSECARARGTSAAGQR